MWNIPLLTELFPVQIDQKILALPVSNRGYQDRWIWGEEKKGKFTVRTAYHLARRRGLDEHSTVPNPSSTLWNKLWTAQVPEKVKICVWKAASNILPTRSRLSERGIDIDTQSPSCEEEVESPIHTLSDCDHATSFLQVAAILQMQQASSVYDWLVAYSSIHQNSFDTLMMIMWAIWRNRNAKVWENVVKQASEVVPITLGWWEEFKATHSSTRLPRQPSVAHWQRPPTDCQVLVDAVHTGSLDGSELGFLLHDLKDSLLLASSPRLSFVRRNSNRVAHALAQMAIQSRTNVGFSPVPPQSVEELISSECNDP
uniref:uncharacterized protein LOC105351944 n=1 Tax=Fragaria vesca subsp. vesca TaxID=101020 RepID=UPI0005CB4DE8|nr:PREDICTED: uncharacterized protein LOC105351944 [Fragaria vesca subsp. vesca]